MPCVLPGGGDGERPVSDVRVLIVDDEEPTRNAIVSLLNSEDWVLDLADDPHAALRKLREGPWSLVLASTGVARLESPLFESLKALAEAGGPFRVLFLVSVLGGPEVEQRLEQLSLPHTAKPLRVHDFLEQVSELLLHAHIIDQPLRRLHELAAAPRPLEHRVSPQTQGKAMFATRDAYEAYTEEDLKEFEEEEKQRKTKEGEKPPE